MDREAWHAAVHGDHKQLDMTYQLNNHGINTCMGKLLNLFKRYIVFSSTHIPK